MNLPKLRVFKATIKSATQIPLLLSPAGHPHLENLNLMISSDFPLRTAEDLEISVDQLVALGALPPPSNLRTTGGSSTSYSVSNISAPARTTSNSKHRPQSKLAALAESQGFLRGPIAAWALLLGHKCLKELVIREMKTLSLTDAVLQAMTVQLPFLEVGGWI